MTIVVLAAGLVLLVAGGEVLVRGASGLGRAAGVSPLVIGLTVVAGATSAPELAVSVNAALTGAPGLAIGNAIGSNTANILLVLALAALIRPQLAARRLLYFEVPVALGLTMAVLALSWDGTLGRIDGGLLIVTLAAYPVLAVRRDRRQARSTATGAEVPDEQPTSLPRDIAFVILGVALLVAGARLLVGAASDIAASLGFSDLVIGLTVVAIGTCLPEIVTSVSAAVKGDRELAIGNVIGSNIFNIGAVLGVTATVTPIPVDPAAISFDIPVMIVATLALAAMLFTGSVVSRTEGLVLLVWFAAYTAYLVLDSDGHDALGPFSAVLLWFCLPVTVVTLLGLSAREARSPRPST